MPSPASVGSVSVDCRVSPAIEFRTVRTCDSGTITAVSVRGGVQSEFSAAVSTTSGFDPSRRWSASRSSIRCRTRPEVASSSLWPATLAAESSSM